MRNPWTGTVAGGLALLVLAAAPERPPEARKVEAERKAKEKYFRDDSWSPLRAFARHDFARGEGAVAVLGSAEDADVRLEDPSVAKRQLRMTVLSPDPPGGDHRFRVEALGVEGEIRVGGEPLGRPGSAAAERIVPEETRIETGPFALRPYVQDETGILILFDSRRTAGGRFEPPRYFPIDPSFRIRAPLVRLEKPEPRTFATSLGRSKGYLHVGYFVLPLRKPPVRVHVYQPTFVARPGEALSILFTDGTTAKETYGAGRYLDLDPPEDGLYTVDFNRAYNPFCAYTRVYNCPIPPQENRLPVAVRAGEKTYAAH